MASMDQLGTRVGEDAEIVETVRGFLYSALQPRHYRNTHEIARAPKARRAKQRFGG